MSLARVAAWRTAKPRLRANPSSVILIGLGETMCLIKMNKHGNDAACHRDELCEREGGRYEQLVVG